VTGDPAGRRDVTLVKYLTNTASGSTLDIAQGWIEFCNVHHKCVHSDLPSASTANMGLGLSSRSENAGHVAKRPTDLVAFGRHSMDAKLVDSNKKGVAYTTLSYCWGITATGIVTTTTATLASRKERIDRSLLPATLQQTFLLTRNLGPFIVLGFGQCRCRLELRRRRLGLGQIYDTHRASICQSSRKRSV
jgi:hypothetical protein